MSPDIRTTETDLSTSKSAARYSGEARLRFGEDVHISAFGLNTHINGELIVRKSPDRELRGEGRVELVDGEFTAYGQRLTIEQGTLTFTGPLDDPIVDVRATRTIEGFDQTVVAGIQLNGRAKNLNSSVFSDPEMSEADALSYLLIGRPLAEATNTEGGDLSTAAVGLGLRQASRVTQQVGQSIGLDQLSVIGDGGDATALVAGKQINQRLYARYAYGVFSRVGMIMLRYRLSERLSLEAGAGETQSIDILYSVEKE
jgi:translocation and assembly module TamB